MNQRMTPQQRAVIGETLRTKYDAGQTISEIALEAHRSFGWTHKVLTEAGTVFRPRGGGSHTKKLRSA